MRGPAVLIAAASALLAAGCGNRAPHAVSHPIRLAAQCAAQPIHLTILGDSLARGWGARNPQNTLAARVFTFVRREHPGTTLTNVGVPGATTDEIARKQVPLLSSLPCALVVVIAGANDVEEYYTPSHFERSYTFLLGRIRARDPHAAVVVMGLPDVALSRRVPWLAKPIIAWLSRSANQSIAQAAARFRAAMVPLYALSVKDATRADELLSADGMHPNDRGYAVMAAAAYPFVRSVLPGGRPRSGS